jgi:hypothetical protein
MQNEQHIILKINELALAGNPLPDRDRQYILTQLYGVYKRFIEQGLTDHDARLLMLEGFPSYLETLGDITDPSMIKRVIEDVYRSFSLSRHLAKLLVSQGIKALYNSTHDESLNLYRTHNSISVDSTYRRATEAEKEYAIAHTIKKVKDSKRVTLEYLDPAINHLGESPLTTKEKRTLTKLLVSHGLLTHGAAHSLVNAGAAGMLTNDLYVNPRTKKIIGHNEAMELMSHSTDEEPQHDSERSERVAPAETGVSDDSVRTPNDPSEALTEAL